MCWPSLFQGYPYNGIWLYIFDGGGADGDDVCEWVSVCVYVCVCVCVFVWVFVWEWVSVCVSVCVYVCVVGVGGTCHSV